MQHEQLLQSSACRASFVNGSQRCQSYAMLSALLSPGDRPGKCNHGNNLMKSPHADGLQNGTSANQARRWRRQDQLSFLDKMWSHNAAYHGHKETQAWAALVLLVVAVHQVVNINVDAPSSLKLPIAWGSVCLLVVLLVVFVFAIIFQSRMKKIAEARTWAAFALYSEMLTTHDAQHCELDWRTVESSCGTQLPECLHSKVGEHKRLKQTTALDVMYGALAVAVLVAGGTVVLALAYTDDNSSTNEQCSCENDV